jgi:hypothetical protein
VLPRHRICAALPGVRNALRRKARRDHAPWARSSKCFSRYFGTWPSHIMLLGMVSLVRTNGGADQLGQRIHGGC